MTDIKDGGNAFPDPGQPLLDNGTWGQDHQPGMTLRDYFAGKALVGMATAAGFMGAPWDKLAKDAYEAADAMIKARGE